MQDTQVLFVSQNKMKLRKRLTYDTNHSFLDTTGNLIFLCYYSAEIPLSIETAIPNEKLINSVPFLRSACRNISNFYVSIADNQSTFTIPLRSHIQIDHLLQIAVMHLSIR